MCRLLCGVPYAIAFIHITLEDNLTDNEQSQGDCCKCHVEAIPWLEHYTLHEHEHTHNNTNCINRKLTHKLALEQHIPFNMQRRKPERWLSTDWGVLEVDKYLIKVVCYVQDVSALHLEKHKNHTTDKLHLTFSFFWISIASFTFLVFSFADIKWNCTHIICIAQVKSFGKGCSHNFHETSHCVGATNDA